MMDSLITVWTLATPVCSGVLGLTWFAHRRLSALPSTTVRVEPDLVAPVEEISPNTPSVKAERPKEPEFVPLMERKGALRLLQPAKAAETFVKWMQGHKVVGVFAASEIDEFWDMACDELSLLPIPHGTLRLELQSIPGVYIGRKSLGIDFIDVRRRTGRPRATLYRIPDRGRSAASQPRHGQDSHPDALAATCQSHGSADLSSRPRRVA